MILGVDVSTYLEELENGAKFFSDGKEINPLALFGKNGVGYMRIRLWNNPKSEAGEPYLAGGCDIGGALRLAALARENGMRILLDFHYSDFWADPAKQFLPKAWRGMSEPELENAVYSFTRESLLKFKASEYDISHIQIGNEITNGILWPVGKLTESADGGVREGYGKLCRLLSAGSRACREIFPKARLLLHLERSGDSAIYAEFFSEAEKHGVDFDIIGASYYPYWHGTPDMFFENAAQCRRRFKKDVMVLEFAYGFTSESYTAEEDPLVIVEKRAGDYGLCKGYPFSPEGQARFVRDFLKRARAEGIAGVFYWEPLWLPGKNLLWASPAGQEYIAQTGYSALSGWANQCLFDYSGEKLPAFDEFKTK